MNKWKYEQIITITFYFGKGGMEILTPVLCLIFSSHLLILIVALLIGPVFRSTSFIFPGEKARVRPASWAVSD